MRFTSSIVTNSISRPQLCLPFTAHYSNVELHEPNVRTQKHELNQPPLRAMSVRIVATSYVSRDALQRVAACCSALQCVAVCRRVLPCVVVCCSVLQCVAVCCSVLQCVAVRIVATSYVSRDVLYCVALCCIVLQCVAVCCNVLPCVAVCCSVLKCELLPPHTSQET